MDARRVCAYAYLSNLFVNNRGKAWTPSTRKFLLLCNCGVSLLSWHCENMRGCDLVYLLLKFYLKMAFEEEKMVLRRRRQRFDFNRCFDRLGSSLMSGCLIPSQSQLTQDSGHVVASRRRVELQAWMKSSTTTLRGRWRKKNRRKEKRSSAELMHLK